MSSSSSSHCRLQERTDSLALSIYRQIRAPKLEDTSSVLLLRAERGASVARVAWVSGREWSWRKGTPQTYTRPPTRLASRLRLDGVGFSSEPLLFQLNLTRLVLGRTGLVRPNPRSPRSPICHRPSPASCFLASFSSPTNARRCRRPMPETARTIHPSHWMFRQWTASVRTLALVHASACTPSLTIRFLHHTPPIAPAHVLTLLRRPHALHQSRSDLAPCTMPLASAARPRPLLGSP
ncbi:hypothetical protein B0H13DRAFT_2317742 [Mycena leptocephala]|nr:hypothetical protein B0H13DRAFT_2317742 [Mycena leptocephala]